MNYPFPPILETIREKLEEELGVAFNHVMLNRYDDGNIYIGCVFRALEGTIQESRVDG
jgi:hypothetical protein